MLRALAACHVEAVLELLTQSSLQNEVTGKIDIIHQGLRNRRGMDMGAVKGIEIGAVRGAGHVEKLAAGGSVVVPYVCHCCEIRTFASERLRAGGMKTVSRC